MKKSIGYSQNFIVDPKRVADLIEKAEIRPEDIVYEIGSGKGEITKALALKCAKVVAIEIDEFLVNKLKEQFPDTGNVEILYADFLNYPLPETGEYKVFSNIPFNITADIVRKLTECPNPPVDTFLFMQFEAAEKFVGRPVFHEAQASVLLKNGFETSIIHEFRRSDFYPEPEVDIVLVRIKRLPVQKFQGKQTQIYRDFVVYAFNAWKPTLGEGLKKIFTKNQFLRLSSDLNFRIDAKPSDLTIGQWFGLFEFFMRGTDVSKKAIIAGAEENLRKQQAKLDKVHRTRIRY